MKQEQNQDEKTVIKRPVYKRWYFWLIIVIIAFTAIGSIAGVNNKEIPLEQEKPSESENPPENEVPIEYFIGDKVTVGSFEYVINSIADTKQVPIGGETIKTENNFILIYLTVTNISNSSKKIYGSSFKLKRGEALYDAKYGANELNSGYEAGAGISRTFFIVFETQDKSSESDYSLQLGGWLGEKQEILLKEKPIED